MAIYNTEIKYEDSDMLGWLKDFPLRIVIAFGEASDWGYGSYVIVPTSSVPSDDTKVSWSSPDGNGEIIFRAKGKGFIGWRRDPGGEERLPYRGELEG